MTKVNSESLAVIVLAAGQSSRLGQMKQLVNYQGESLLRLQCIKALNLSEQVYCVLGYQHELLIDEMNDLPVNIVINENWQQGLSSSIACAISSLSDKTSHAMLILVDQWQLTINHLNNIKELIEDNANNVITATLDNDSCTIGPPVIFPKRLFLQLENLTGKTGAKVITQNEANQLISVVVPEAFVDLDTPKDLEQMKETLKI